jgi:hypothetical protein
MNANTRAVLRAIGAALMGACLSMTVGALTWGVGFGILLGGITSLGFVLWMHGLPRSGP